VKRAATSRPLARAPELRKKAAAGSRRKPSGAASASASRANGAKPGPLPDWIPPQLATLVTDAPRGDGWLHEIKYDGYRMLLRVDAGEVRLLSRSAKDWTGQFSRVARAATRLAARSAMLDGEVIILEPDGTTSFQKVQNAVTRDSQERFTYAAFDLIHLDGCDLTGATLEDRKAVLAELIAASDTDGVIHYSDHVRGRGPEFFREACRHSLEGIVSKRADAPYSNGRTRDWLKLKCVQTQEFVIGGFSEGSGTRTGFGALLLGVPSGRGLRYAGRVGTGFSEVTLRELSRRLKRLERAQMPFLSVPADRRHGAHWVEPELVAEVAFMGWTTGGHVRHPSFRGIRDDRSAADVTIEQAAPAAAIEAGTDDTETARASTRVAGVKIGNASKVLYPDIGLTKLEIARYYEMVAPWMVPQVTGRPLTLLRCPNGYDSACFFQKNAEGAPEQEIRRVEIPDLKGDVGSTYLYVDDAAGLVALLQMGVLEIHIWGSRQETLELPDRITFDLDPGPGVTWEAVLDGARLVRSTLAELGLESLVMTTGGKGLHVVVPVVPELDWPTVKGFTRALVQAVVRLEPRRYTAHLAKNRRENVIFIDYLRNGRGATAVAPYSTRARAGAPVAVPISWDELSPKLRPDMFNVRNLADRLRGMKKDPWQQAKLAPQSLAKVLDAASGAVAPQRTRR